jgi:sulfur carrier protein ThiS adenylyltransferase
MQITLNERLLEIADGTTLQQVRRQFKPDADLVVFNGFPVSDDPTLAEGDRIVLIRRGEHPSREEMGALMAARHTPGVYETVQKATVGIAGVGGLGSFVAGALARIGVGHLIFADFDVVEPSNLNRQQYFVDQIGMPKVEAMRQNLHRINPYIRATAFNVRVTPENIPALFTGVDVMVEAFDSAEQKAMLVESFLSRFPEIPLVAASGLAGHSPSNTIRTRKATRSLYLVGDGFSAARPGCGLMAPRVGVAAHHQANAVLRLLLGEEPE